MVQSGLEPLQPAWSDARRRKVENGVGFEKIGPYEITRYDLLVASVVISFLLGSGLLRLWMAMLLLVALGALVLGVTTHDWGAIGGGTFLLFLIFGASGLRSRKDSHDIYVEQNPDGLAFEMPKANVLYKWSTIGRIRKIGPRLFVMINSRCALVIPDRATSAVNMQALIATIAEHRPSA